jgi:hypothetical protein
MNENDYCYKTNKQIVVDIFNVEVKATSRENSVKWKYKYQQAYETS